MQDRYDELDLIVSELDSLISRITDKNYIEQLEVLKSDAQSELEQIEPCLQEQYDREEAETNYSYERSAV